MSGAPHAAPARKSFEARKRDTPLRKQQQQQRKREEEERGDEGGEVGHQPQTEKKTKRKGSYGGIMSLTENLPHLFRKRTLQRKLELLEGLEGEDSASNIASEFNGASARQDSFTEGSVLFEDNDEDFAAMALASAAHSEATLPLLNSAMADPPDGLGSSVGASHRLRTSYYPPEPGLPAKSKDLKWLRILASCIVVSSNGVQYSLSQFTPYVSQDLGSKCMASAISLLICFFTLGCIFHGCFLMKYMPSPRADILLTSPLVFALVLSSWAVEARAPWLMQVSFALTGFGIGPSFLSAIIHLQFWLPKNPALASSIGMAFGGLGSVVMAMMIEICIQKYGIGASFKVLALTLFGLQVGGGLFLKMPDLSTSHAKDLLVSHRSKLDASVRFAKSKDTEAFKSGLGMELRSGEILSSWQFALFWISAFTGVGPGYAIFANLATLFNKNLRMSKAQASTWVVLVNLIATLVGRLPTGYLADRWNQSQRKLFGSGCRSMFLLYHSTQTVCLAIFAFVEVRNTYLSLILIVMLACVFGGCNVLIAALSRELFAPINSSVVYGLILTATAASSLIFPNAMPALYKMTGNDFAYTVGAAIVSCAGALCCILLQPLPQAYGISPSLLEANS